MGAPDASDVLLAGVLIAGAGLVAGCGGGGGDDAPAPPPPPKNVITGITVKASGTAVSVNGVDGGPSGVAYALGGAGPRVLAPDPGAGGAPQSYSFAVTPSGTPASVETLAVVINPLPADVIAARGTTALAATRDSLARIGFAPSWDELMAHAGLTHAQIVDRALARLDGLPAEPYPAWIDGTILSWNQLQTQSQAVRDDVQNRKYPRRQELKGWFFRQMVLSPDALEERLLLFWHNLFTSSASSLDHPELMARQHRLYRQYLAGNFGDFVKAMSRDPGMCEYLDSARNSAKDSHGAAVAPNENFARELLELFTLGERTRFGGYAEDDIKALARFFTGYHLDYQRGAVFDFDQGTHDTAAKPLFGQTRSTAPSDGYAVDGDWAIDRILAKQDGSGKSYCARYIVTRLWREFIGTPAAGDAGAIQALADGFAADWNLKALYRAFFTSAAFTDPARRAARLRSPIELWVGFYRAMSRQPTDWNAHLWSFYTLDQDLLDPPNVFGWPGNESWINLKTVIDRRQHLSWLIWNDVVKNIPPALEPAAPLLLLARDPIDPAYGPMDWRRSYLNTRIGRFLVDPAYNLG